MSKYSKKTGRSRRRESKESGKSVRIDRESGRVLLEMPLPMGKFLCDLQQAIGEFALDVGMELVHGLLREEVEQVAGEKNRPSKARQGYRWGTEESYVCLGGMKRPFRRPRVRSVNGGEISLERMRAFQGEAGMDETVMGRVLRRVSMRDYAGTVDEFCDGYGIQKSSVSRQWKKVSSERLREMQERSLEGVDPVVIMVDGITFHDYTFVVALGIASDGKKQVIGLWSGATENSQVCGALFDDLAKRGLPTDRTYLFLVDGSKALLKAIHTHFGKQAVIQRCQVHKERNVLSFLPKTYHRGVRRRLRAAWGLLDYDQAKKALEDVVKYLEELSSSAADSLREAFEETLTLHRLGVPAALRQTLRSTNPIESLFSRYRDLCRNVKNWKNEDTAYRWAGTVLLKAEEKFRRIPGYQEMPVLIATLRPVDPRRKPAQC